MTKVVINRCFGGFSLSKEGVARYCELASLPCFIEEDTKFKSLDIFTCWLLPEGERLESKEGEAFYSMSMEDRKAYNAAHSEQTLYDRDIERHDPYLVQLVEENSQLYSGRCADLSVVEIPDGVDYEIEEYDGREHVAEKHRTWY
jgi:hypothetical protein